MLQILQGPYALSFIPPFWGTNLQQTANNQPDPKQNKTEQSVRTALHRTALRCTACLCNTIRCLRLSKPITKLVLHRSHTTTSTNNQINYADNQRHRQTRHQRQSTTATDATYTIMINVTIRQLATTIPSIKSYRSNNFMSRSPQSHMHIPETDNPPVSSFSVLNNKHNNQHNTTQQSINQSNRSCCALPHRLVSCQ